MRSVLLDLGGVLETGCWPGVAEMWAPRLAITTQQMLAAVFGGSDETVPVGQMSGVAKPGRRIFELALGGVGAEPGQALFIDDTPGHVAAARALGIARHGHTGPHTTAAAIEAFIACHPDQRQPR